MSKTPPCAPCHTSSPSSSAALLSCAACVDLERGPRGTGAGLLGGDRAAGSERRKPNIERTEPMALRAANEELEGIGRFSWTRSRAIVISRTNVGRAFHANADAREVSTRPAAHELVAQDPHKHVACNNRTLVGYRWPHAPAPPLPRRQPAHSTDSRHACILPSTYDGAARREGGCSGSLADG